MITLQPVILSGGSGTRLWPLSREAYPKQFLPLTTEKTLLQETVSRLDGLDCGETELARPFVVCNEAHRFLVAEQLRLLDKTAAGILLEPVGRNTAPALTLAALQATAAGGDPLLIAMPADHHIEDPRRFLEAVQRGMQLAEQGFLVTFGIVPTAAEAGYGYIRKGDALQEGAFRLAAFVEKPDAAMAQVYLDYGDYLWNSGIFMMHASLWLQEIRRYRPDIFEACQEAFERVREDGDFLHIDQAAFTDCPSDSIDYAVMEKVAQGSKDTPRQQNAGNGSSAAVVPLDAGWSDVGSWSALLELKEKDAQGNVTEGDTFIDGAHDTLLLSQHRYLAGLGVSNLIVVETADAVLVADKARAQDVKAITDWLKQEKRSEHRFHTKVHRPWGSYEGVDEGHRFQVKRLSVNPGASLSLQMHHHRAEHWIVVSGTARVTRGDETFLLSENQSTYIPLGTCHRLENPGTIPLEIIEVQSGSYLGEDDIVRFEDKYNRGCD